MISRLPIEFIKMHGSGNDFVVIRMPSTALEEQDLPEFARMVCRRGTSLGADGVIAISPSTEADFRWRYINADGSDGDMCGNGAMVGARFALEQGLAQSVCSFETQAGIVHAEVEGERVRLQMIDAKFIGCGLIFDALPGVEFDHLQIGVPHVVGVVADADAIDNLHSIGAAIRNDAKLHPDGANVNIINSIDRQTIRMRTYERGVEDETLACGTGAICSAVAAARKGLVVQPVTVRVSSGMDLEVTWRDDGDNITDIRLAGTARIVATGEIVADALL